jgi:Kef-type K+ transport system membrane component KefB
VARAAAIAFGFLALTVIVGRFLAPPLFALLERLGGDEILAPLALSLAFLLAVLAERAGSAAIVGAFAAGLVIEPVPQAAAIRRGLVGLGRFFVPIFFVLVGAAVDVRALASAGVWMIGGALIVVGALGKLAAGWAPMWMRTGLRKDVIGVGMIPRGEVGLIFAQTGLAAGVLDATTFGSLMLMVVATTFLAPPLLRRRLRALEARRPSEQGAVAEMTTEA